MQKLLAHFNTLNTTDTHPFMMMIMKKRRNIARIPDCEFPRFSSREHCVAWKLFADACEALDIIQFDYLKIKKLDVYDLNNGVYRFVYILKTGWFKKETVDFNWDSDWEIKLKEKQKEEKQAKKFRLGRGR